MPLVWQQCESNRDQQSVATLNEPNTGNVLGEFVHPKFDKFIWHGYWINSIWMFTINPIWVKFQLVDLGYNLKINHKVFNQGCFSFCKLLSADQQCQTIFSHLAVVSSWGQMDHRDLDWSPSRPGDVFPCSKKPCAEVVFNNPAFRQVRPATESLWGATSPSLGNRTARLPSEVVSGASPSAVPFRRCSLAL